jgi:DNA-binding NtrC family response regulator
MAAIPRHEQVSCESALALWCEDLERELAIGVPLRAWMQYAEAWRIREALRQCRGNRSAAARALGIGRRTLYTKMEKLRIQPARASTRNPDHVPPLAGAR